MEKISLAGEWRASLREPGERPPARWEGRITLPGTTALSGLGDENRDRCEGYLTERFPFAGRLWVEREFTVSGWADKTAVLTLERTRLTRVFLDGQLIGRGDSLCAPHVFVLPALSDGRHTLSISVDNTGYPTAGGHMTSPDTQTNWNGITGEISLTAGKTVFLFPRTEVRDGELLISCRVLGKRDGTCWAELPGWTGPAEGRIQGDTVCFRIPLPENIPLWDEEHPNLVTARIFAGEDALTFRTGIRRLSTEGRRLLVNGREVFLRGRHEGLQFPLTGCAPWDTASWRREMETAKEYGLNHIRCHTCCPPEAAFEAADELGVYIIPELPFWGTVPARGEEADGGRECDYLEAEGLRILEAFGAHPSMICLSLGNELWGSRERLDEMIRLFRAADPGRLYSAGANNFQFAVERQQEEDLFVGVRLGEHRLLRGSYARCDGPQGRIQTDLPGTDWDYDGAVLSGGDSAGTAGELNIQRGTETARVTSAGGEAYVPDIPVVTHEVGQYEVYPDFSEIPAYRGVLAPRNLEVIRERMQQKGLLPLAGRYRRASGKLAADCYRMEIEAALRSRELSGFQLLDLIDYMGQGTAMVGMLDGLRQSKGLIDPANWRRFCGPETVLARFPRFVYSSGEPIPFRAVISDTRAEKAKGPVLCELIRNGETIESITLAPGPWDGRLRQTEPAAFTAPDLPGPEKLSARFRLEDGTENVYSLWVFPEAPAAVTKDGVRIPEGFVPFVREASEAQGPAIVIPDAEGKLPAEYCGDFWCYPMFKSISESMGKPVATGTMGLLIDPENALLSAFPADDYTTPPWYPLLKRAHCEPVPADAELAVEMIDHWARMERLGLIWQEGRAVFCTVRLWEAADEPAAKWLALSLGRAALAASQEEENKP